ncbi:MAG: flavodoxin family protein [Peptococcaceae bacterium]|nr:flavodoxin family protein [Peptococcaceae bacterium]
MKVLLVNGSPHAKGCTYTALCEVAAALEKQGIETELFQIGTKPVSGCLGCGACIKTGKCVIDDVVNEFVEKAKAADGFVFGSPVHFANASGAITSFMDRAFYGKGAVYADKPVAAIMSCRRGGATATLDQLNKYFTISNMPIVSSQYWNMVHGNTPDEVRQDAEGMQTMRTLGTNMAWLLKCIEAGKAAGVAMPEREAKVATNFIR